MLFRIDLGRASQRRMQVSLELTEDDLAPTPDGRVVLSLPTWTPGSYLVREFARHVSRLSAADDAGRVRDIEKIAKNRWSIDATGTARLTVSWTVYAHELTVRTAYVTEDWAFWNGACAYLWPVGREHRPARFEVVLPDRWSLFAGSAEVTENGRSASFSCADLDTAVDTPCLAADVRPWSVDVRGREHRVVPVGLAGVIPPTSFEGDVRRVLERTCEVFGGELPYARYTFLALFGAEARGGLEHADCSTLLAPRTTFRPASAYQDFLALVAHEFLHVWNVKRLRPAEFWSLDLERENYTRLLWVAEGFTAYYDDLLVLRAGIGSPAAYLTRVASHIEALRANPGRRVQSLGDASFDAWILLYRPDENTRNATQNYYTNGALAALVLDAEIRRMSGGVRCLDDAMRHLWATTYEAGRGYDLGDVTTAIGVAAGGSLDALAHGLVDGAFEPELERALGLFGLQVIDRDGDSVHLGVRFRADSPVLASVEDDGPAWLAGLCPGDEVLAIDGLRVSASRWATLWDHVARPGESVRMLIAREGVVREVAVVPGAAAPGRVRITSVDAPSELQLAHREAWLGSRELGV